MKNEMTSCSDMITMTFQNINKSTFERTNKLADSWKKIITSIKSFSSDTNIGENMYEHSNVVEIKNNILLIEADHPGWIQMFQMNKKYILNGLKMYVPELNVQSLAFRLKGSNASLTNVNYYAELKKESSRMNENLKKEEKILEKFSKNDADSNVKNRASENSLHELEKSERHDKTNALPDDLLAKFKNMENIAQNRN